MSGVSRCIDRLRNGLVARGANVDVLSALDIPRVTLGEWRFSSFLTHWPDIARRMRSVDVVNIHGPIPTISEVFLRLVNTLPAHRRPAVVYTHHAPIHVRGVRPLCALYNRLHVVLAQRADCIIASSTHYAGEHAHRFGPIVRTIPWGVHGAPARTEGAASDRRAPLRVLFVGQMRPYKGIETLLPAVAGMRDVELTLVGNGARLADYRRLASWYGVDNAIFVGRLSDEALREAYLSHDVIVLPSVTPAEAFGLVLLEGMAAGCVPIASHLPGVRDVAGPTGLLVPPSDVIALRKALAALAADRDRLAALSRQSRARAEQLTWDACVDDYHRAFLEAAHGRYLRLHGHASERFSTLLADSPRRPGPRGHHTAVPAGENVADVVDLRSIEAVPACEHEQTGS